ncbi:MAG: HAMP domain-containing histidine kinase [Pseudomonadota bacterium]|nr:HAMP domain-containing histidine kinase [Pseudomonadota bacterium]
MALTKYADYATQIADYFIPPAIAADREAKKRARIFLYSHLFGPFIGSAVPLAVFAFDSAADYKAGLLLASILSFWLFPFVLKYTSAYRTLAFLSIQTLIFAILWSCYCYGGVRSPTLAWALNIPLLSFLYIGPSSRLRLALAAQFVVSALLFFAANQFFEPPPLTMSPIAIEALGLVSTVAAALYVVMMALFYANALASQVELKAEIEGHLRTTADFVSATESARRSSAAKAEFIAKMSHELRTPLNAVIGYSEILLDEAETEDDAQSAADLKRIHGAGVHLLKLVNEILDLSRIEAGRMETLTELVDCGDLLRSVAGRFEEAARMNDDKVIVDAPVGVVLVDAAKLSQVIEQLLENAIAFTKQGEVRITAERIPCGESERLSICVADTGCGIPPERLEGFLDRLETVEEADGRQEGGAGVGLLLSKRLCELIGGTLSLESAPGQGTRAKVDLVIPADALERADLGATRLGAVAAQMRRAEAEAKEGQGDAKVAVG